MARILIIEDDDDFRKMLQIVLTQAGYEVIEAPNGEEGLTAYKEGQIDLVVTDIFMPEKEGTETMIELKEYDYDVKIIAISGGGTRQKTDYLDWSRTFVAQKTFKKPFAANELLEAISDLLET